MLPNGTCGTGNEHMIIWNSKQYVLDLFVESHNWSSIASAIDSGKLNNKKLGCWADGVHAQCRFCGEEPYTGSLTLLTRGPKGHISIGMPDLMISGMPEMIFSGTQRLLGVSTQDHCTHVVLYLQACLQGDSGYKRFQIRGP